MVLHSVRAVNTAPDSENKIHDDAVAATFGFRGGLVPGVTVYGYMTLPVLEYFGEDWLARGAATVRFKEPVYDGEDVSIEAHALDDGRLEVVLGEGRGTGHAWMGSGDAVPRVEDYEETPLPSEHRRPAAAHETLTCRTTLGTLTITLDLATARLSAPLPAAIGESCLAHPAVLLGLANQILVRNFVLGPWIHVASEVANYSAAKDGEVLTVRAFVTEQYERKEHEFVVLDVLISAGERVVEQVLHTAIWQPRQN